MSRLTGIKWRQGDILSLTNFPKCNLAITTDDPLAVAISHSCDICSDEPAIEFVSAKIATEGDGNYTNAKHLRKLHLPIHSEDKQLILELIANNKFAIQKHELSGIEPTANFVLNEAQRKILQEWLSARYKRHALPDALQARLDPVFDFLEKQGKKNSDKVLGYWINYDPVNDELPSDQTYDFFLYIVYLSDNPEWRLQAEAIVHLIKENFSILVQKTINLGKVKLVDCRAYSEEEFTIKDQRRTIHYRFDYLSYRTNPPGPTI